LSEHDQESIVIEAWTTRAERQQELIGGLLELLERFRSSEGFIEARILKGSRGTTVLSYLRMRSAADRQRLDKQPEIQAGVDALRKIAHPHRVVVHRVSLSGPEFLRNYVGASLGIGWPWCAAAVFLSSRQNGRVFQPNAAGCAGPRWFRFGASSEAASVPGCAGVPAGGASREPCWRRRPPTGPR